RSLSDFTHCSALSKILESCSSASITRALDLSHSRICASGISFTSRRARQRRGHTFEPLRAAVDSLPFRDYACGVIGPIARNTRSVGALALVVVASRAGPQRQLARDLLDFGLTAATNRVVHTTPQP